MNAKGGMDENEFELYLIGGIVLLYPDVEDTKVKLVLIKINSGPSRLNMKMIARLRNLGFILYTGVSNTTSVTQETDQSYGIFKSRFCKDIELIT